MSKLNVLFWLHWALGHYRRVRDEIRHFIEQFDERIAGASKRT